MSALENLHTAMEAWSAPVQHGAAWIIGAATIGTTTVHDLEASNPLVHEAIDMAVSWAKTKGVPVNDLANLGKDILSLARSVAPPIDPLPIADPAVTEEVNKGAAS